jgi:hypothetical protein
MYLSHPVRRMRDSPTADEDVALAITVTDESAVEEVAVAVGRAGGTVEDRLRFGTLRVVAPQDCLDDICAVDGIDSVETTNTLSIGGDAGEDVERDV